MSDLRKLQRDALTAISAEDWASAVDLYVALEKADPSEGTWPLRLGECWHKLGQEDDAVEALLRALQLYLHKDAYTQAAGVCKLLLEIDPNHREAARVQGWLHERLGADAPSSRPPIADEDEPLSAEFQVPSSLRKAERGHKRPAVTSRPSAPRRPAPRTALPPTPLFSPLTEEQRREVKERARPVHLDQGQILFAMGEAADALYVVLSGQLSVLVPHEVARLHPGDYVGEEVMVLPSQVRMSTLRAAEACQVLALDRGLLTDLTIKTPMLLEILTRSLRERLVALLAHTSPLLAPLAERTRLALLERFAFSIVDGGRRIYPPGQADAGLFVLLAGTARSSLEGSASERLGPGDVFGEIGLVTDSKASAIVTASERCFVLHLPRADFETLRQVALPVIEYLAALARSRLEQLGVPYVPRPDRGAAAAQPPPRVFLVHGNAATLRAYARAFGAAGFVVDVATDIEPAHNIIANERYDVIVCNLDLLGQESGDLLGDIRRSDLDVPIILTSLDSSLDTTGGAASYGVVGSYVEPLETADLVAAATRAVQFHRLARVRREAMSRLHSTGEWMGDHAGLEFHFGSALDRLWMAFQPIVSASAQDVVAFEALLRSGEEVLRSPVAVLRAAERLHRVHDVGRIIRDSVAATAVNASKSPLLCVNLHSQDLLDQHLLDPQSPLSAIAPRVILEITERTPLDELNDLRSRLTALRSLGYRFAIDNLGAGHAGVATLAQLEPDVAKLDISLIRGVDHDQVKQEVVRSMLEACRDMNIQVICEGVETSYERDTLVRLGADFMQGYLFAKPGPPFPSVDLTTLTRRR